MDESVRRKQSGEECQDSKLKAGHDVPRSGRAGERERDKTYLRDSPQEVLQSKHGLEKLIAVDVGPGLLDSVRVAWRARRELASGLGRVFC